MALALASFWRCAAVTGFGLLALAGCETGGVSDASPAPAPTIERPARVTSEIERGRQALSAGDLPTAQAAFNAALRGSPNDPEPALGLAETYLALGDLETSERLFNLIAKTLPETDDARLLQGRGLVALRQGKTDEAVRLLERSVDRDPGQWRAWAGLGRAYGRQGRSRQARDAFGRAEGAAPAPAVVINDLGMLHLGENDPASALGAFERALAIDPMNETASANARIARAMLGDYDAAVSGARPDELPDVLNNVGYIAIVNGDFEVADRLLRRAVEISPVYHEAATANLDLLAQAMKGVPLLALAGGVSTPQATAGTELSSVSGDLAVQEGSDSLIEPAGRAAAETSDWLALAESAASENATGRAPADDAPRALLVAAVDPQPSAVALAQGFRWESLPVSAQTKPARSRSRRRAAEPAAASSAAATDGDPRSAAWPVISPPAEVAAPEVAAPPAPERGKSAAQPSVRSQSAGEAPAAASKIGPAAEPSDDGQAVTLAQDGGPRAANVSPGQRSTMSATSARPKEQGLPE